MRIRHSQHSVCHGHSTHRLTLRQVHWLRCNYLCASYGETLSSKSPILSFTSLSQHAHAVENLSPFLRPGCRVLDVGSGSGYLCALFHYMVSNETTSGKVVGIEHIPQLVDWSTSNLKRDGLGDALRDGQIIMVSGDGRKGEFCTEESGTTVCMKYSICQVTHRKACHTLSFQNNL